MSKLDTYYIALHEEYGPEFNAEQFELLQRKLGGAVLERPDVFSVGGGKIHTLFIESPHLYAAEKEVLAKLAEDEKPVTVAMLRQILNAGAFK